jgi:hypothetical protein
MRVHFYKKTHKITKQTKFINLNGLKVFISMAKYEKAKVHGKWNDW